MAKLQYEVLEEETLEHDGTVYSEGEIVELEEKEAKGLIKAKVIKAVGEPTPKKPPSGSKKTPGGELAPPTGGVPKPVTETKDS